MLKILFTTAFLLITGSLFGDDCPSTVAALQTKKALKNKPALIRIAKKLAGTLTSGQVPQNWRMQSSFTYGNRLSVIFSALNETTLDQIFRDISSTDLYRVFWAQQAGKIKLSDKEALLISDLVAFDVDFPGFLWTSRPGRLALLRKMAEISVQISSTNSQTELSALPLLMGLNRQAFELVKRMVGLGTVKYQSSLRDRFKSFFRNPHDQLKKLEKFNEQVRNRVRAIQAVDQIVEQVALSEKDVWGLAPNEIQGLQGFIDDSPDQYTEVATEIRSVYGRNLRPENPIPATRLTPFKTFKGLRRHLQKLKEIEDAKLEEEEKAREVEEERLEAERERLEEEALERAETEDIEENSDEDSEEESPEEAQVDEDEEAEAIRDERSEKEMQVLLEASDHLTSMNEILNRAGKRKGLSTRGLKHFHSDELRIHQEAMDFRIRGASAHYIESTEAKISALSYTIEDRRTRMVPHITYSGGKMRTTMRSETYYVDITHYPTFEEIISGDFNLGDRGVEGLKNVKNATARVREKELPFREAEEESQKLIETLDKKIDAKSQQNLDLQITKMMRLITELREYRDWDNARILEQWDLDDAENFKVRNTRLLDSMEKTLTRLQIISELVQRKEGFHLSVNGPDFDAAFSILKGRANRNALIKAGISIGILGGAGYWMFTNF